MVMMIRNSNRIASMRNICIFKEIVFPVLISLLFFASGNIIHMITAAFILSFIPFSVFDGIKISRKKIKLSGEDKTAIEALVSSMWKFFSENITENENFLPPDNVQYTPVIYIINLKFQY